MNLSIPWSRALATASLLFASVASAQDKPNILVIWGDDVGWANISAYNLGMMGYETPNIDRIAEEGALFTHYYAQQSCTAGRSSFILGQHPFRTGLLTVGMPGSPHGIPEWAPTIADLLKDCNDLEQTTNELIVAANERGGNDNVSIVLLRSQKA